MTSTVGGVPATVRATASPAATSTPTRSAEQQFGAALTRAIEATDYAAIVSLMAPTVRMTIEATECCSPGTPAEVVPNLSWLSQGLAPWSFDQSHPRIVSIKTRYASTYGGSLMIYSSDGIIAAFWFNDANLIDRVRLANGRLLGP
ncbi:MAG: hypothetical protein U0446_06305 [Dehalococcoidia bacterium]